MVKFKSCGDGSGGGAGLSRRSLVSSKYLVAAWSGLLQVCTLSSDVHGDQAIQSNSTVLSLSYSVVYFRIRYLVLAHTPNDVLCKLVLKYTRTTIDM